MAGGDEEEVLSYGNYNLSGISDEEPYEPEVGQKISVILKLNNDIKNLIENSSSPMNKDVFGQFFYYKIIGEGGDNKVFGRTLNHKDILQKYLDGTLPDALKNDISKKVKSAAIEFFRETPQMGEEFKLKYPNSFDENGNLVITNDLVIFLLKNARGTKRTPMILLKRIRKDIQNLFLRNAKRNNDLNDLVINSGLINPRTNQPFTGIEYLNNLLKVKSSSSKVEVPEKELVEINSQLNEDTINEELLNEGEGDETFSFNDILNIAKASTTKNPNDKLQEARKFIRNMLMKNFIK
jgi:hypothetical protein